MRNSGDAQQIEVGWWPGDARYPRYAFFYGALTPTIQIDQERYRRDWGSSTFVVSPGRHLVAASYPWLFMRECGRNKATVDVQAGESTRVSYRPWLVRFVPGRIRIESARPGKASA
jgi:hypothetical protein